MPNWSFIRESEMLILTVIGESRSKKDEYFMIKTALYFIKIAEKFKGIPIQILPNVRKRLPLNVYFTLIFPSEESLYNFIKVFKSRL